MTAQNRPRLLLLNPPGTKPYMRDYFGSKVSKSGFCYHPIDLVYLSGYLDKDFELSFIDAIVSKADASNVTRQICNLAPDVIVFLTAGMSVKEDMAFMQTLANKLPNCKFFGMGDIYLDDARKSLKAYPFHNGAFYGFFCDNAADFILNSEQGRAPVGTILKTKDGIKDGGRVQSKGVFNFPLPRWDLVDLSLYSYPFERRKEFASLLTDCGCPNNCSFCPISTLGFGLRELESVEKELQLLKSLNVNELYFRDQTFGADKKRTLQLLDILKKYNFTFACVSRADVLDEELLAHMKQAGCHTIGMGVESASNETRNRYEKNISTAQIQAGIKRCHQAGIDVFGFLILGLPGETEQNVLDTIDFAISLNLDFASFNIAMPRLGSTLRQNAIAEGILDKCSYQVDSTEGTPEWKSPEISPQRLKELQKMAYSRFYKRPGYILKRLLKIRSFCQLVILVREGLQILIKRT